MNVLFTAFSLTKGLGGHTRSMRQVMDEIGKTDTCFSLIFGQPNLKNVNSGPNELYIDFRNTSYFKIRKILNEFITENKIDLIHSFDDFSFVLCQLGKNIPRVLTRCGGTNPTSYPAAKFLTCFSKENFDFFKSKEEFSNTNLYLIPNRTKKFDCDTALVKELEKEINKTSNDTVLLRIARIGPYYVKSINQSINLLRKFQKENIDADRHVKLIILGAIYDQKVFDQLKDENSDMKGLYFITEDKYTKEAKKILDIADVVIGTGRGFMEAASKEKILFAPEKGSDLPMLVNETNFDNFFYHNFSERTVSKKEEIIDFEFNKIIDSESYVFPISLFEKYFNIENGIPLYQNVYKEVVSSGKQKIDLKLLIKYLIYCKYLIYRYRV